MHVAMMLYAGFRLLEVTGPMDVFHEANRLCGGALYEQHLVGPSPGPVLCSNGVAVGTTECLLDVHLHSISSSCRVPRSLARIVTIANWWSGSVVPDAACEGSRQCPTGLFSLRARALPIIVR